MVSARNAIELIVDQGTRLRSATGFVLPKIQWRSFCGRPASNGKIELGTANVVPGEVTRSTRSMSPLGTPAVVPSMFIEVGCPSNTCTPVESPHPLYMLSRALTLRSSLIFESRFRRKRLV